MSRAHWDRPLLSVLVRHRLGPRRVLGLLALATGVLAIAMGITRFAGGRIAASLFNPDGEWRIPAFYSAGLLVIAGVVAVLLAGRSLAYLLFGLGLLAMAFDEVAMLHERLEYALQIDWQILYLPVFLVAIAVLGAVMWVSRRVPLALPLLAAGLGCWAVSQVLEAVQWDGDVKRPGYPFLMFTEEVLEMLGTCCLIAGLVAVAWAAVAPLDRGPRAGAADQPIAVSQPRRSA